MTGMRHKEIRDRIGTRIIVPITTDYYRIITIKPEVLIQAASILELTNNNKEEEIDSLQLDLQLDLQLEKM